MMSSMLIRFHITLEPSETYLSADVTLFLGDFSVGRAVEALFIELFAECEGVSCRRRTKGLALPG